MTKKKFLNLTQAAAELGITPQTIRNWDKKGIIKITRTLGGHRRVSTEEIERILKQQTNNDS